MSFEPTIRRRRSFLIQRPLFSSSAAAAAAAAAASSASSAAGGGGSTPAHKDAAAAVAAASFAASAGSRTTTNTRKPLPLLAKLRAVALTASLIAKLAKDEKKRQLAREAAVKRLKKEKRLKQRQEQEKRKQLWDELTAVRERESKRKEETDKRSVEIRLARERLDLEKNRAPSYSQMAKHADSVFAISEAYGHRRTITTTTALDMPTSPKRSLLDQMQRPPRPHSANASFSMSRARRSRSSRYKREGLPTYPHLFMSRPELGRLRPFERKGARISTTDTDQKRNEYSRRWEKRQTGCNFTQSRRRRQLEKLKQVTAFGDGSSFIRNTRVENCEKRAKFNLEVLERMDDGDDDGGADGREGTGEMDKENTLVGGASGVKFGSIARKPCGYIKRRIQQQRQALEFVVQEAKQACELQNLGATINMGPIPLPKQLGWSSKLKASAVQHRANMIDLNGRLSAHATNTSKLMRDPQSFTRQTTLKHL
jgi:hypothetical protein